MNPDLVFWLAVAAALLVARDAQRQGFARPLSWGLGVLLFSVPVLIAYFWMRQVAAAGQSQRHERPGQARPSKARLPRPGGAVPGEAVRSAPPL